MQIESVQTSDSLPNEVLGSAMRRKGIENYNSLFIFVGKYVRSIIVVREIRTMKIQRFFSGGRRKIRHIFPINYADS